MLFLFLVAAVIAFLLNPLVRDLQAHCGCRAASRSRSSSSSSRRRSAFVVAGARQRRRRSDPLGDDRIDNYVTVKNEATGKTGAEQDIDRLQHWLDTHGLERIQIQKQATDWVDNLGRREISKLHAGRALVRPGRARSRSS